MDDDRASRLGRHIVPAIVAWAAGALVVWWGAQFGYYYGLVRQSHGFMDATVIADGAFYKDIAEHGYSFDPSSFSTVAFFPAYPLLVRSLSRLTRLGTTASLLVVANASFFGTLLMTAAYLNRRRPVRELSDERERDAFHVYTLMAMALVPFSLFCRMPYTESLFMLLCVLTLYAFERRWPLMVIAALAGLASGTRPVGVALLLPLAYYVVRNSASAFQAIRRLAWSLPIGCWGLLAYMLYQHVHFHNALAFAQTQEARGQAGLGEKLLILASAEPIRSVYDPQSPNYWQNTLYAPRPIFSMQFLNPVVWLGTLLLIAWGAARRWSTAYETLLALPLLLIPYGTVGYEGGMNSEARYAMAVIPVYPIIGRVLLRLPPAISMSVLSLSAFLLGMYAASFMSWHGFY